MRALHTSSSHHHNRIMDYWFCHLTFVRIQNFMFKVLIRSNRRELKKFPLLSSPKKIFFLSLFFIKCRRMKSLLALLLWQMLLDIIKFLNQFMFVDIRHIASKSASISKSSENLLTNRNRLCLIKKLKWTIEKLKTGQSIKHYISKN